VKQDTLLDDLETTEEREALSTNKTYRSVSQKPRTY
jgi:hypothetical protein